MRLLVAVIAFAFCAAAPNFAVAHSKKEATIPADGAVLSVAPSEIGISFDAPMRITLTTLKTLNGKEIPLARNDGMQPVTEFRATPESLAPGEYEVEWRGLAEDGHAMQGSFRFEIAP